MYSLGIISDIHSNSVALESVLTHLKSNFPEVEEIYCLGDIVGYGPEPKKCLEFLLCGKENFDHLPSTDRIKGQGIGVSLEGIDIPTLEGTMLCRPFDWIIKGVNGEFYPCKPDIFEKTYEEVVDWFCHYRERLMLGLNSIIPMGLLSSLRDELFLTEKEFESRHYA